jgi:hypothetical protein
VHNAENGYIASRFPEFLQPLSSGNDNLARRFVT